MNKSLLRLNWMKVSLQVIFFFCLIFSYQKSQAQVIYDCVDSNRVNPFYNCGNPTYLPVCGCNGVTYRNECSAYFAGGVNYNTSGTCENFGIDILQNPVDYFMTLSVYTRNSDFVYIQVWNLFGKIVYEYSYTSYALSVQELIVETDAWDRGMYIVLVVVNGEPQSKKLVRVAGS